MSYEVLVEQLRAAAGDYRTVAGSLGTDGVEVTHLEPGSVGHVELAAWMRAVADQCDKATRALHDGATGLADSLQASAGYYETTDQGVADAFRSPFGYSPGSPFGSSPLLPPAGGAR
jgi:hypothetical protein